MLQIRLDERDSLFCDDQPVTLTQLQQQVESFVAAQQTDRYIIAVQTDRATSYDAYFEMQNAVVAAHRVLREKMAQQKFGRPFSQCSEEQREVIRRRYPQRISEGMGSEE